MHAHFFEFAVLLTVLALAAGASVLLRLPVVPLYIASGVALGRILEPDETVAFLGSLGVVFLLFALGLEFSIAGLTRDKRSFFGAGTVDWALNFPVGLLAGWALGLGWIESLFLGGIVYMSSSAVVTKCIVEFGRSARPETETILKVMVFEDFVIAVFLVLMQPFLTGTAGEGFGPSQAFALLRSFTFVLLLVVAAHRFTGPIERLLATRSDEAFTLVLFAFIIGVAAAAIAAGLSEAIGAFLAGLVLGATGLKERAARTLAPSQTLFAALFFVTFGMQIEIGSIAQVALPAVLLVVLGLTTKTVGGFLGARVAGHASAPSIVVGLSLVPKGEFSIVMAGLAASLGGPGTQLEALAGLYVFALSILGPIGMREADRAAEAWRRFRTPPPAPDAA